MRLSSIQVEYGITIDTFNVFSYLQRTSKRENFYVTHIVNKTFKLRRNFCFNLVLTKHLYTQCYEHREYHRIYVAANNFYCQYYAYLEYILLYCFIILGFYIG